MASNRTKKTEIKPGEKIDRLSSLPDHIIQHILSFLPSTLTSIKTCVLSKQWRYQWTHVPALIFDYQELNTNFSTFVSSALILHDSPTITKFVLKKVDSEGDIDYHLLSLLPVWILFAKQKQVKELTLKFGYIGTPPVPEFFFNNDSLVKFEVSGLEFYSCGQVNWPSLKVLSVEYCFGLDEAIENIVSGSPLLESLQFMCNDWHAHVVIASSSLKRLVVRHPGDDPDGENAALEIACPNLEELELSYTFVFQSCTLVDLPPSARVTLYLRSYHYEYPFADLEAEENSLLPILQSVKHVDVLNIGASFLQVFSVWVVVKSLSPPLMNSKCLTLNVLDFNRALPGIVCLLRNSPVVEKLLINFEEFRRSPGVFESYDFGEKYWNSQENVLNCLASPLKTIEISGFMGRRWKDERKLILRFIKFLIENTKSLEEMAIFRERMAEIESCRCRNAEEFERVSHLLSIQRWNPGVNVSVSCCKGHAIASKRVRVKCKDRV